MSWFSRSCPERTYTRRPIRVRHPHDAAHSFAALRTMEGTPTATGDMTQIVHADLVNSRLILNFRDESVDHDRTIFFQRRVFRLISDTASHAARPSPSP